MSALGGGRACPGCGTSIRPAVYACGGCWRRLPAGLRTALLRSWGRRQRGTEGAAEEHQAAKLEADQWLGANPR